MYCSGSFTSGLWFTNCIYGCTITTAFSLNGLLLVMNEEARGCIWQYCLHLRECQLVWQDYLFILPTVVVHVYHTFEAWLGVGLSCCLSASWKSSLALLHSSMRHSGSQFPLGPVGSGRCHFWPKTSWGMFSLTSSLLGAWPLSSFKEGGAAAGDK